MLLRNSPSQSGCASRLHVGPSSKHPAAGLTQQGSPPWITSVLSRRPLQLEHTYTNPSPTPTLQDPSTKAPWK